MSLSRNDQIQILRHLQEMVRQSDPELFERLANSVSLTNLPRENLLAYLHDLIAIIKQRSADSYQYVLSQLNQYIETESGNPIEGIIINFSPQEGELYGLAEFHLREIPDHSEFVAELLDIMKIIENELEDRADQNL